MASFNRGFVQCSDLGPTIFLILALDLNTISDCICESSVVIYRMQVDSVKLLDRFSNRKPITGTLYLTATHLIFVDPLGKKETWVNRRFY